MTPLTLARIAEAVAERMPLATLVKNAVGNIAIVDPNGMYAGYIDLAAGAAVWFEDVWQERR